MTQVASYQVPAHPSGLDMRTQLNAIVLAILGDNSGPSAPTVTYPGMMWGDTTALRLKRRNNANTAWIDIGPIDNFLGDVSSSVTGKVNRAGDTMTGALSLYAAGSQTSFGLYLNSGGYAPFMRSQTYSGSGFEWINGANSWAAMSLSDGGALTLRQNLTLGSQYGVTLLNTKGAPVLRGDGGIGPNGGVGFINAAGNNWNLQITDEGNIFAQRGKYVSYGASTAATMCALQSSGQAGWSYADWRNGPVAVQVDAANTASCYYGMRWTRWGDRHLAAIGSILNSDNTSNISFHIGDDPSVWSWMFSANDINRGKGGYALGTWNFDPNSKVNHGVQITWASGIRELGALAPGGGDVIQDASNPWALEGLRCTGGGATWIWPRAIWYATP